MEDSAENDCVGCCLELGHLVPEQSIQVEMSVEVLVDDLIPLS